MPVKWSALMVNEAMDMVEEYVDHVVEPLEQARIVASEARNIPNLPQYVDQHLVRIIGEIDRAIGGSQWEPVAEACAYLMTVSLTQPMDSDWTQIYLYIAGQSYKRWNKGEMPADIAVDSISDYQIGELNRLKAWLYRQRIKVRAEKDRAERREEKEEAEIQKKAERPALFEF